MKLAIVKRLIIKDLQVQLWPVLGLAAAVPAVSLSLALAGGENWRPVGLILMTNSMIWLGFFLPFASVISDKRLFVLSLPVSIVDYAASKIVGGLAVFSVPWLAFVVATPAIVARHETLNAGAIAPIAVLLVAFLVSFLLTLAVALAFESTFVTTGVGLLMVVVVFAFVPLLRHVPQRILEHWAGEQLVWDPELIGVLAVELLCGVVAVFAAFALLQRKRSFV